MRYKWYDVPYRKLDDMLDSMVQLWLTSYGRTSRTTVLETLDDKTDEELSEEMIKELKLDKISSKEDDWSHMGRYGYTKENLLEAFARIRKWFYENPVFKEENNYECNAAFYQTLDGMLDSMIDSWLMKDKGKTQTEVLELFVRNENEHLAEEMIADMALDKSPFLDYGIESHMEMYKYTKKDLIEAFDRARLWYEENVRVDDKNASVRF
jgi:hypothetical protein